MNPPPSHLQTIVNDLLLANAELLVSIKQGELPNTLRILSSIERLARFHRYHLTKPTILDPDDTADDDEL